MMDGRNCTGRKISLLNDSSDVAAIVPSKQQLPPLTAVHSYDSSSCASTPSLSPQPQTPRLVRSDSDDSRRFATPSPLTPSYNSFEANLPHHRHPRSSSTLAASQPKLHRPRLYIAHHSYSNMDDPNTPLYPPIPDGLSGMPSVYPMAAQLPQSIPAPHQATPQTIYRSSDSPSSEPSRLSAVSGTSNAKAQPKKNQYPCPMAKQVGCTDFFTTSGHAARHAKKHTGKKDAYCPECNKAFTRKDNMEQHRRTHQNGRGAARSSTTASTTEDAKVKKPSKPAAKKSAVKAEPELFEAAVEQHLAEQASQPIVVSSAPPPLAPSLQQVTAAQQQAAQHAAIEQAFLMNPPATGPYFLNGVVLDSGPVPSLPMAMPELSMRPTLQRSNFAGNLDYVPPMAPMVSDINDPLHYSYPSPGLSNGLNSLALAASEHRRLSEEKSQSRSPRESSQETPQDETPGEQS